MKILHNILLLGCIQGCMLLWSCDVHEFPDPATQTVDFTLHLNYDESLPLYKVITYDNNSRVNDGDDFDIRYFVKVYPATSDIALQEESQDFVFTKDDISTLNNSVTLPLLPGSYNFIVWTDYVKDGTCDLYYNTSTFEEITLLGEQHEGSNDMRDAFYGSVASEVSKHSTEAMVNMRRPMAKFNFISDDVSEFVSTILSIRAEKLAKSSGEGDSRTSNGNNSDEVTSEDIQFSDFDIVLRYQGFMPNAFNTFTNKPCDAKTGVSFKSKLRVLDSGEAELGFDYVFVNGSESTVSVSVEVYDYDGELISRFKPVDVPLVRSKLTTIKARFLTSGDGGVAIEPDFDGNYNYIVD